MNADHELTCRDAIEFLMAYLDDELSPQQRAAFDQHLAICPSCVNYLRGYTTTVALAQASDPLATTELPEGLARAIRAARCKP